MKKTFILIIIIFSSSLSFSQKCITNPEIRAEINEDLKINHFIAHIVVHRGKKRKYNATVSFISPNVIIGAGHSFREKWYTKVKRIEIFIGQRNKYGKNIYIERHVFSRSEIKILVNSTFQKKNNPDYDFAMVSLPQNIVNNYFNLITFEKIKSKIATLNINGYPGDKGNKALWTKNTPVNNIIERNNVLLYDMFTYTGDSGAPIWTKLNDIYYIVGVHGTGHYRNGSCNAGIKLTKNRINFIKKFIKKSKVK